MEDVVGFLVIDERRGEVGFLSWGRIHGAVDSDLMVERIRGLLPGMGFENVVQIELCEELGQLRDFKYFYEGLIAFASKYAITLANRGEWLRDLRESDETFRKSLYLLPGRRT